GMIGDLVGLRFGHGLLLGHPSPPSCYLETLFLVWSRNAGLNHVPRGLSSTTRKLTTEDTEGHKVERKSLCPSVSSVVISRLRGDAIRAGARPARSSGSAGSRLRSRSAPSRARSRCARARPRDAGRWPDRSGRRAARRRARAAPRGTGR